MSNIYVNNINPLVAGGVVAVSGTMLVTGSLAVSGNTYLGDASGDTVVINANSLGVPNNLNIDSNTLMIDSSNNRIGIGTASPTKPLHVQGDALITGDLTVSGTFDANVEDFKISANAITVGDASGDSFTINSNTVTMPNATTFDCAADITLDADGGNIFFKDNGTLIGALNNNSNKLELSASVGGGGGKLNLISGMAADITLDSAANVILDADGGTVSIKDGGTTFLDIIQSSGHAILSSSAAAKDIVFHGDVSSEVMRVDGSAKSLQVAASGGIVIRDNSPPSTPSSGYGVVYVNSDKLYFKSDAGTAFDLTVGSAGTANVAADNITTGDAAVTVETTSGNVVVDSNAGTAKLDGHTGVTVIASDSGNAVIDSNASIHLSGASDVRVENDLRLDTDSAVFSMGAGHDFTITHDGTTGATIAGNPLIIDGSNYITLSGAVQVRVENDLRLDTDSAQFGLGAGNDFTITHDGSTGATIAGNPLIIDGSDYITLSGAVQVRVENDLRLDTDSAQLGLGAGNDFTITHDGATGATIAGTPLIVDGGDYITLSGAVQVRVENDLRLDTDSAQLGLGAGNDATFTHDGTTGLTVAATPISVNSVGNLSLSSSADVVIDAQGANVTMRNGGTTFADFIKTSIDTDSTYANSLHVDSAGVIKLDAHGGDIMFAKAGTTRLSIAVATNDAVLQPSGDAANDIIFKDGDESGGEVFRLDGSAGSLKMASGKPIQFADTGEYISGDGNDLTIASGRDILLDAVGDIILDANGDDIVLKDNGVLFGQITNAGGDLQISASVGGGKLKLVGGQSAKVVIDSGGDIEFDADGGNILFKDGGTLIGSLNNNSNALELSASVGGGNGDLKIISGQGGDIELKSSNDIVIDADGANVTLKDGGTTVMDFVLNGTTDIKFDAPGDMKFDAAGNDYIFDPGGTESFRFTANGASSATWDVVGKATIDSDGGTCKFADGGATYGQLTNDSGELRVDSSGGLGLSGSTVQIKMPPHSNSKAEVAFGTNGVLKITSGSFGPDIRIGQTKRNITFTDQAGSEQARLVDVANVDIPANTEMWSGGFGFKRPVVMVDGTGGDKAVSITPQMSGYIFACLPDANSITFTLPAIANDAATGFFCRFYLLGDLQSGKTIKIKSNGAASDNNDNLQLHTFTHGANPAFDGDGDTVTIVQSTTKGSFVDCTAVGAGANEEWIVEAHTSHAATCAD